MLMVTLPGSMCFAAAEPAPQTEASAPVGAGFSLSSMPPVVLEFESCIRGIRDERSAIDSTAQVQALVPRMKELLQAQRWENPEEAFILAQILNSAFNLLLTDPPCYGSPELAEAIGELLSVFTVRGEGGNAVLCTRGCSQFPLAGCEGYCLSQFTTPWPIQWASLRACSFRLMNCMCSRLLV